jgi:hypothetical protein
MTFVNLKTLIIFNNENNPNLSNLLLLSIKLEINSKGIAANKSRKNLPFMYFAAIYFESVISSPVIKSEIVVLKLNIISRANKASVV